MPRVSIIIPVYNAERYLSKTLDSVLGQTFKSLEVVCVNDGSTDRSIEILEEYKKKDKRIKVISQDNSGGSAARNVGIEHTHGEYIMFLDSDDIYAKNIVGHAYDLAVRTGSDVVLYNFSRFIGKPTPLAIKNRNIPEKSMAIFTKESYAKRLFNDFATITWNKLVKKDVIINNKLMFNVKLSHNHDVDFSIRLMLAARSYSWLDEVGYYYRTNNNGLTATRRSDPTNVLRILINLNKLVVSHNPELKQSFDNYVADMVVGTLDKYGNDPDKQEEIIKFTHKKLIPASGLGSRGVGYFYDKFSANLINLIERGEYTEVTIQLNRPKRRLLAYIRRLHGVAQSILSRFPV